MLKCKIDLLINDFIQGFFFAEALFKVVKVVITCSIYFRCIVIGPIGCFKFGISFGVGTIVVKFILIVAINIYRCFIIGIFLCVVYVVYGFCALLILGG